MSFNRIDILATAATLEKTGVRRSQALREACAFEFKGTERLGRRRNQSGADARWLAQEITNAEIAEDGDNGS